MFQENIDIKTYLTYKNSSSLSGHGVMCVYVFWGGGGGGREREKRHKEYVHTLTEVATSQYKNIYFQVKAFDLCHKLTY